jgi:hypothetical protein
VRRFIVAVGACVLAAMCVPVAQAKEASVDQKLQAVNELLATRAKAEIAHDRDAFAKTIDPNAPSSFRDAQLKSFDNLAALPVASLTYEANVEFGGDLSRGATRAEYGDAPVFVPETLRKLRFAFDGDRPWIDDMWFTYVQRNGQWFVGGDDDLVEVGLEPAISMWDRGPVVMVQGPHVALIAHPAQQNRAQALLGIAEQALTTLSSRWPLPWTGTIVGVVPESPDELTDLLQASVDVTKFVAFVSYGIDTETYKTTAPRLFVQDQNLGRYSAANQTETLVHEFVHAAGARYASAFIPAWLHEGLADWLSVGPTNPYRRGSGSGDVAPRDDQFGAGSQGQIVQAYKDAQSLVAALSRIAGAESPFTLFKTVGAEPIRAGARAYVIDEALRTLGFAGGLPDLEAKWRDGR